MALVFLFISQAGDDLPNALRRQKVGFRQLVHRGPLPIAPIDRLISGQVSRLCKAVNIRMSLAAQLGRRI